MAGAGYRYGVILIMHLNRLKEKLDEEKKKRLFPCIKDLVTNGLELERFPDDGTSPPSRQDITQYVASWCRHIGMDPDTCMEWMTEYCIDVLSVLSSSSNSRIRHSTKGNIKYIYRSAVDFECRREENPFKAHCDANCPVYEEMAHIKRKPRKRPDVVQSPKPVVDATKSSELTVSKPSVKAVYKEQFKEAITVIKDCLAQDLSNKRIVTLLNKRGFKTKTGKKWSYSTLRHELKRLR